MEKLLKSRKFVFGLISVVAALVVALLPQTEKYVSQIVPLIGLIYAMLALGTTFEDGVRTWAENRPANTGQALQDMIDELLKAREVPATSTVTYTQTVNGDAPASLAKG